MTRALAPVDIDSALVDPRLLGAALGDAASWSVWRTTLKAAFAIDLTAEEARTFASVAGGRKPPLRRVRELWAVLGRRSGKSRMAAAVAVYLATLTDHRARLSAGEVGTVLVLAASRAQAAVVYNYARSFIEASPTLAQLVEDITADEIRLKGGITIAVHATSFRTIRGRTLVAAIFDEAAFWRDEMSSQPDIEVYRAVLPALATTNGMLIAISSPYSQRGLLYAKHRDCYGRDDQDALVVQAPTETFNPTIDLAVIANAQRDDPESAQAEWYGEFRGDLSTFVDRAVVENCVERGRHERGYVQGPRYSAFADPSGGAHDSFTLAIAHREGERVLLDAVREFRAPFDPPIVVEELIKLLRAYRCNSVRGDRYAAEWVRAAFHKHQVYYVAADQNRSEIYLNVLPLLMSGNAVLLDNPRLVAQFSQLERRTMRTGRDAIDHMRGASDDLCNAVAGSLVYATRASGGGYADRAPPRVINHYGVVTELSGHRRGRTAELTGMIPEPERQRVAGTSYSISAYGAPAGDGRQRWNVHKPDGEVATTLWGKAEAEDAARQLDATGSFVRTRAS